MSQQQWSAVDDYIVKHLVPTDHVLDAALAAGAEAGLPAISVSPAQGRLLQLLAATQGAENILEIGTLAGYSTICLARGLAPGGRVVTLEIDPAHADVARANFVRAGLDDVIDLRLGPAIATLPVLVQERQGPFDMVFIDADKASNPDYLTWSLRLSRPGTLIVVDNVVRDGSVIEATSTNAAVQGTRKVIEQVGREPSLTATVVQTVGDKGYDGFLLARVTHP
jgi:predicted O-methyltransferase YrrM